MQIVTTAFAAAQNFYMKKEQKIKWKKTLLWTAPFSPGNFASLQKSKKI